MAGDITEIEGIAGVSPEAVFAAHFPSLTRTAFLIVGDAAVAEELVMEAFVRTLPRWRVVEYAEHPVAYVRRAVVNLAISRLRRLAVERRAAARSRREEPARWDTDLADETRTVVEAIGQLPNRQRACIALRYFDDLPEKEIAATLGCSVGTVKSQLAKARVRLAGLLGPVEEG